jgi:hypothetical protein
MRITVQKAVGALVFAFAVAVTGCGYSSGGDPGKARCGVVRAEAIAMRLTLAHASDFGTHFPSAPAIPELAGNQDPADVIVFTGQVQVAAMGVPRVGGGTSPPNVYLNAVCVTINGVDNLFATLDLEGAN